MFRIVIADADDVRTTELAGIFSGTAGFEVIGTARNGAGALYLTRRRRPDVVFVDISLPPRGGLAIVRAVQDARPGAQVVVMTADPCEDSIRWAAAAGADGVLSTDGPAKRPVQLHWLHPDEDTAEEPPYLLLHAGSGRGSTGRRNRQAGRRDPRRP